METLEIFFNRCREKGSRNIVANVTLYSPFPPPVTNLIFNFKTKTGKKFKDLKVKSIYSGFFFPGFFKVVPMHTAFTIYFFLTFKMSWWSNAAEIKTTRI